MRAVREFDTVWSHADFRAKDIEFDDLFAAVMNNGLAVLRGVFPKEQLRDLKAGVFQWGANTAVAPPQSYANKNYHVIEAGISPRQKTPHHYHAYNFHRIDAVMPRELSRQLLAVYEPLLRFRNNIAGNNMSFVEDANGCKAHPQISCHPCGGGVFGRHTHPFEPTRIGLILGMSERGTDFQRGATHFEVHGRDVGTDDVHNLGDLIVFRYDIPHWVTPVDEEDRLDYSSPRGRWVAVLPVYKAYASTS
jgi:hypothetical protein